MAKKRLLDFQKEAKRHNTGKSVVFVSGSFNPFTRNDSLVIERAIEKAKADKMDIFIFTERRQNPNTLPLKFEDKVGLIESAYPEAYVNKNRDIRNVVEAFAHLEENQYKHIHVIAPSEAKSNTLEILHDFNMEYTVEEINCDPTDKEMIKEAIYSRDIDKLKSHLPQRLRENTSKIMADLVSGYMVHISESLRVPVRPDNIKIGDKVQSINNDISTVLCVDGDIAVCESILNYTLETYRLDELSEVCTKKKKKKKMVSEEAPPDEKIKKWLEEPDVIKAFKDRYGEDYKSVMFGKAWNMYNNKKEKVV